MVLSVTKRQTSADGPLVATGHKRRVWPLLIVSQIATSCTAVEVVVMVALAESSLFLGRIACASYQPRPLSTGVPIGKQRGCVRSEKAIAKVGIEPGGCWN